MKRAALIAAGFAVLVVILLLPLYERMIAASAAILVVSLVAWGFLLRPKREVFYLHTKTWRPFDNEVFQEHDCVAVRLEVVRLWLLFVPTFLALALLLITYAHGKLWNLSLFALIESGAYPYVALFLTRLGLFLIAGALYGWLTERWILRDAQLCNPKSMRVEGSYVSYAFVDRTGAFYGGGGFCYDLIRSSQLARLILYNIRDPQLNKMGKTLLFHRLVVIARGVTDLDHATVVKHALPVTASE